MSGPDMIKGASGTASEVSNSKVIPSWDITCGSDIWGRANDLREIQEAVAFLNERNRGWEVRERGAIPIDGFDGIISSACLYNLEEMASRVRQFRLCVPNSQPVFEVRRAPDPVVLSRLAEMDRNILFSTGSRVFLTRLDRLKLAGRAVVNAGSPGPEAIEAALEHRVGVVSIGSHNDLNFFRTVAWRKAINEGFNPVVQIKVRFSPDDFGNWNVNRVGDLAEDVQRLGFKNVGISFAIKDGLIRGQKEKILGVVTTACRKFAEKNITLSRLQILGGLLDIGAIHRQELDPPAYLAQLAELTSDIKNIFADARQCAPRIDVEVGNFVRGVPLYLCQVADVVERENLVGQMVRSLRLAVDGGYTTWPDNLIRPEKVGVNIQAVIHQPPLFHLNSQDSDVSAPKCPPTELLVSLSGGSCDNFDTAWRTIGSGSQSTRAPEEYRIPGRTDRRDWLALTVADRGGSGTVGTLGTSQCNFNGQPVPAVLIKDNNRHFLSPYSDPRAFAVDEVNKYFSIGEGVSLLGRIRATFAGERYAAMKPGFRIGELSVKPRDLVDDPKVRLDYHRLAIDQYRRLYPQFSGSATFVDLVGLYENGSCVRQILENGTYSVPGESTENFRERMLKRQCHPFNKTTVAVKATGNPIMLRLLNEMGIESMDVASDGEALLVEAAKIETASGGMSHPGVSMETLRRICKGLFKVGYVSVDTENILRTWAAAGLSELAQENPDFCLMVRTQTTGNLSLKFGVVPRELLRLIGVAKELGFRNIGIAFHPGTQNYSGEPYGRALQTVVEVIKEAYRSHNVIIRHINTGGGLADNLILARRGTSLKRLLWELADVVARTRKELREFYESIDEGRDLRGATSEKDIIVNDPVITNELGRSLGALAAVYVFHVVRDDQSGLSQADSAKTLRVDLSTTGPLLAQQHDDLRAKVVQIWSSGSSEGLAEYRIMGKSDLGDEQFILNEEGGTIHLLPKGVRAGDILGIEMRGAYQNGPAQRFDGQHSDATVYFIPTDDGNFEFFSGPRSNPDELINLELKKKG